MLARDSFEDRFRDLLIDGYGSYALFVVAVLVVVLIVLRATRTRY